MSKKQTFLRQIGPYQEVHLDMSTGIAWVECGSTGAGYSCHPNIDVTGSVKGMRARYWGPKAVVVRSHGFYYNCSSLVADGGLDLVAVDECCCSECGMAEQLTRNPKDHEGILRELQHSDRYFRHDPKFYRFRNDG